MKRLPLAETWKQCLRMWRWIVRELKKGGWSDVQDVGELKAEWLKAHGFEDIEIAENCFFCEYTAQLDGENCRLCPAGRLEGGRAYWCEVGNDWKCHDFAWDKHPAAFLRKLEALYKKYKEKK